MDFVVCMCWTSSTYTDKLTEVIAVAMANTGNSIHRACSGAAVALDMLPMVQRANGTGTPLHIEWAPEGTPAVMSQG